MIRKVDGGHGPQGTHNHRAIDRLAEKSHIVTRVALSAIESGNRRTLVGKTTDPEISKLAKRYLVTKRGT